MTEQDIKDVYWNGWETCVGTLVKQFESIKTEIKEKQGNEEGIELIFSYFDNTITVIQDYSGVRERVEAAEKERSS